MEYLKNVAGFRLARVAALKIRFFSSSVKYKAI